MLAPAPVVAFAPPPTRAVPPPVAAPPPAPEPTPASELIEVEGTRVTVALMPKKSKWTLGEPIDVDFVIENPTKTPLDLLQGGDTANLKHRHDSFKVALFDGSGAQMVDPLGETRTPPFNPGVRVQENVGERWSSTLRLQNYAKLDKPGTYLMNVHHDLAIGPHVNGHKSLAWVVLKIDLMTQIEVVPK